VGIEIPFPQRDVNIKPGLVPAESSRIKKGGDWE
jgi:small-conductance mechanosensitive channel